MPLVVAAAFDNELSINAISIGRQRTITPILSVSSTSNDDAFMMTDTIDGDNCGDDKLIDPNRTISSMNQSMINEVHEWDDAMNDGIRETDESMSAGNGDECRSIE